MPDLEEEKRSAAYAALDLVRDGMVLGLGTGSTVAYFLEGLSKKISGGLKITGVPTSIRTMETAVSLGIPIVEKWDRIDMDVDGADLIDRSGNMIKGGGGALLREKIVAHSSDTVVIICDSSKYVDSLRKAIVPVEIIPFGAEATAGKIMSMGCTVSLRGEGTYRTDNGNLIADCAFSRIEDPQALDSDLHRIPGVVDTGIFARLADRLLLGINGEVRTVAFNRRV